MRRWSMLLAIAILCLWGLGALGPPRLRPWLALEELTAAVVWYLAFALAGWAALALLLAGLGIVLQSHRLIRVACGLAPRLLRAALPRVVATAVVGVLTTASAAALAAPIEVPPPPYVPDPAGAGTPPTTTTPGEMPPGVRSPGWLRPRPAPSTYVVVAGDNLWRIACRRVSLTGIENPSSREIVPYWLDLIELNRDRIRSGNPDLIYPGEVLLLP